MTPWVIGCFSRVAFAGTGCVLPLLRSLHLFNRASHDQATFDMAQARQIQQQAHSVTAHQAIKQSRTSRGLFDTILRRPAKKPQLPKYKHVPDATACRVVGQLEVKKVTANLHITTLGHGYSSRIHVPHDST